MSKVKHVKSIRPELRHLLEEFLAFPDYQGLFKEFAKVVGYDGDDIIKVKSSLFIPNKDGEIMFSIEGMYELFFEYQLLRQLIKAPLYKELLEKYPEAMQNIRTVAQKMLNKEEIDNDDLMMIFNEDEYERRRTELNEQKQ